MNIVLNIINDISKINGRKTKLFRDIARSYKKEISVLDINTIYTICEQLLDTKKHGETIIAYQLIYDVKDKYNEDTFDVFEKWLNVYIEDWWDCDDFMTHAFQFVLMKYPKNLGKIKAWVYSSNFAVRRSAAVVLIRPAQKGLISEKQIFLICDLLMDDGHYLVQKGYGWLLKESCKEYHDSVVRYLVANQNKMTRTAFRYALEKLSEFEKEGLMRL